MQNYLRKSQRGSAFFALLIVVFVAVMITTVVIMTQKQQPVKNEKTQTAIVPSQTLKETQPTASNQDIDAKFKELDTDASYVNQSLNDNPIDIMSE